MHVKRQVRLYINTVKRKRERDKQITSSYAAGNWGQPEEEIAQVADL
jgi:hypothetical protein